MNLFCLPLLAQKTTLQSGVEGHWSSSFLPQKKEWKAYWVWSADDGKEETKDSKVLFRKTFSVSKKTESAKLFISASSLYKLYINGKYINRGPLRSAPHHQSYDVLEIKEQLQEGENLIAIEVHYQKGENAYHLKGRGGLLAELHLFQNEKEVIIASDDSWKAKVDASWDSTAPTINRFQLVVADKVDLSKFEKDWETPQYNDSKWANAVGLQRNSGWPHTQKNAKPRAITTPWTLLEQRHSPYLTETDIAVKSYYTSMFVEEYLAKAEKPEKIQLIPHSHKAGIKFPKKKDTNASIVLKPSDKPYLLVADLGKVHSGMPQFEMKGEKGLKVEVVGIPFMVDHQFTYQVVDSRLMDEVYLSGDDDKWQSLYFKPTRYLAIVVHPQKEDVIIQSFGLHKMAYPFEEKGTLFSKGNDWIANYVKATNETIDVCTTDAYTDNYRERRQYAQTGFYGALGNYYTFGDYILQAQKLVQVAQEAETNGLFPAYGPLLNNDYMVIIDSNLLWVRSLRNYFLYSGDQETVKLLLPTAYKILALMEEYTNAGGLIDNPPYAYWLDHAKNDRRGANLNLNGHYIGALEDMADILQWLEIDGAKTYSAQAKLAKSTIQKEFWNDEKGLFVDAVIDGKQSTQYSEHAQAMALSFKIATKEQADIVISTLLKEDDLNYIKRSNGMFMVTPAMSYFLHKGIAEYGYIDASFSLFRRRFDQMLEEGMNGTLWEEWWRDASGRYGKLAMKGRTRSDAQTESAFATALFAEYLLGVEPTQPGMTELSLARMDHQLGHINGTLPTPNGNLGIEWIVKDEKGTLSLSVPKGIKVNVETASLLQNKKGEITLNNQKIDQNTKVTIQEGEHLIKFQTNKKLGK